jgi:phosphate transport system substrate-binding protein
MDVDYTTTAPGAYAAILITYQVVCSGGLSADKTALLKDFLGYYASTAGQKNLEALGYAPLPPSVQSKVAAAVNAIA